MKKYILEIIGIICVLSLLIKGSVYIVRPDNTDQCVATIEAFHNLPENSIDVLFLGSSHGWRGVNVLEMYEQYGQAVYNYGGNWQRLSTESLFFYDALRTQKPKVVFLETYRVNELIIDQDLDGEIYYTRAISHFPYKWNYLKQAFGKELDRYVAYYFPLAQFHSAWKDINANSFIKWYTTEEFENTMGYYYLPQDRVQTIEIGDYETFDQYELSDEAVAMLDDIVDTCEKENIELILYTVPFGENYNYSDALTEYAKERDIVYLDLFKYKNEIGLINEEDYCDLGHMNYAGATKIADFLGKYVDDNYDLEDMRLYDNNIWQGKIGKKTGNKFFE
ncbi:MAG: hypothetical protein MJ107_04385 [Lachnospiraceae bacterium]|nr:hypothetical protein [Lachnospiraceae bacterium]